MKLAHALKKDPWHLYWCGDCRAVVRWFRNTAYAIHSRMSGYARCPECNRWVTTRHDGNLYQHGIPGVTRRCPGSGVWVGAER